MHQPAKEKHAERVSLGVLVDRLQKDEVFRLAREQDCSVSRIVRKALAAELERTSEKQR